MALDFDEFPLDDPILEKNSKDLLFGDTWRGSMSVFIQTLVGYLSQNGMFVPKLTTDQRDAIQSPEAGQFIYNTTTNQLQVFKPTGWTVVV